MGRAKEEARSAKTKHTGGAFEKGKAGSLTQKSGRDRIVKSPITPVSTPLFNKPATLIKKD